MENIDVILLKKQRQALEKELKSLQKKISDYENIKLEEKFLNEKKKLEKVNQDFEETFGDNMKIMKRLFSSISSVGYYGFSVGLVNKLHSLDFYYLWQVVSHTELELQQKDMLGILYTSQLKENLAEMGLFLGMKLD